MTTVINGCPPVLSGCSVLPPMVTPRPRPVSNVTSKPKRTAATPNRFGEINSFVDFTLAGLSRNETAVWLVLWRDTKDGTSRTAQIDIARRAGISRRTVIRILAALESKGLLQTVHRGGLNRGMNVYRIHPLAKPP